MTAPRIVVVGSGAAGAAAALSAARAGAEVTLIDGGTGATVLAPGAIDLVAWDSVSAERTARDAAIEPRVRDVLTELDLYELPRGGARVATMGGITRAASGVDRALLDLASLGAGDVIVPRCDRPGWDADILAQSFTYAELPRGRRFVAIDAALARHTDERALPHADFAARHDDAERLAWLAARLLDAFARARSAGVSAIAGVVLPPSLGVIAPRARALSDAVGVPCGEALAAPGGPAGLRFERARDRAVAKARVRVVVGRVKIVSRVGDAWRIEIEDARAKAHSLDVDRVILAAGGLIGGGVAYTPGDAVLASAIPPSARPTFQSTIEAPVRIGAGDRPLDLPGSLFGVQPESLAWPFASEPLLERAGILADDEGRVIGAPAGLYVAGDLTADRARTFLQAIRSGVHAAIRASASARA